MVYTDRNGNRIIIRARPTELSGDFWTDTGVGKFITGFVNAGQGISNIKLPTVKTEINVAPETKELISGVQKTLLYSALGIGATILLSKLLKK